MRCRGRTERGIDQRGIALIAVTAAIALTAAVTVEFGYQTSVDYASAANARDEMRAHFLARSGINLSRLVIQVQKKVIDPIAGKIGGDVQIADYAPMILGAFTGGADEVSALASMVGVDPAIGGSIKGLGLPAGEFNLEITSEDGKLNVNAAGGDSGGLANLEKSLVALVTPVVFNKLFENEDGDGQRTDRSMFVRALIDYIDKDEAAYPLSGQPEIYGYDMLKDPYKAKNHALDSVAELQLVRGMDDAKWAIFGPVFTVYGGKRVNLSAVQDLQTIIGVLIRAAKNADDPVITDPTGMKLLMLAVRIIQLRAIGMPITKKADFIEFVKEPDGGLGALFEATEATPQTGLTPPRAAPVATGAVQGMELDPTLLDAVATFGPRRVYRVVATSKIGRVEKKITAVFDTNHVNQNNRDDHPVSKVGTWVYWREE